MFPTTTSPKQANCPNGRCKFHCNRMRHPHRVRSTTKVYLSPQIVCTGGLWLENIHTNKFKMSNYAKELLAIYFAFNQVGHIFCRAPKPVTILTDNKTVTQFFQTKSVPALVERMCLCHSVDFCDCPYPWSPKLPVLLTQRT